MSAFTERWSWRALRRDTSVPEAVDHLNERLRELDRTLNRWANDLEYGPIPGSYVTLVLSYSNAAGIGTGVLDLAPISFYAVPKAVTLWIPSGEVTCRIDNTADDSILTADAVVTSAGLTLNDPGDFAVDQVTPGDLHLQVLSIDSGTPVHISATIVLQNVTNVEAA